MNTDRELMQQALKLALEALDDYLLGDENLPFKCAKALAAIREALAVQPAQQEPEYKGWYCAHCQRGVDGSEVTYHEQHTVCGRVITDDLPPAAQQQEPVAWRDHVEQRLLTWRQSFVNKSGDQLALDDFMDKRSLDDLIDFVCDEYTSTPASKPWVGLTDEEELKLAQDSMGKSRHWLVAQVGAKLREKNA